MLSTAFVVATGVNDAGDREVLGFDLGLSEEAVFWTAFLRDLVARGLRGGQLVISDAHTGRQKAIGQVLQGASWQRCRVHFMRNLLAPVPKSAQTMVAARVRTIFAQPDQAKAYEELARVAKGLRPQFPAAAELLEAAREDILAYMAVPGRALKADRFHQPAAAAESRYWAPGRCGRDLPDPQGGNPARRRGVDGIQRRMGGVSRRYFNQQSMAKSQSSPEVTPKLAEANP